MRVGWGGVCWGSRSNPDQIQIRSVEAWSQRQLASVSSATPFETHSDDLRQVATELEQGLITYVKV